MSSAFPSASSEIGGEIAYPLLMKNTGDTSETLNLLATIPEGWDVRFISSSKMVVLQVYLQPGESEQLTVVISPPIDVGIGSYNLTIKAVALDGELASSLDLKASIRQPLEKVEVAAVFKEVTVKAGASLRYPITIRNKGEKDSMLLLSIDSIPENWDAVFELEGGKVSVSQVLVTAGGVSNLDLIVTPPSIVNIGNYKVVATIKTMDGTFEKQIDVVANIIGSYSLKASASTLYTSATSGGSASFTVTVTNSGQSPVTTLKLFVDAPSGWESSLTLIQIASVAPKESSSFNVLVDIPDTTVAGDYMITVKAGSDQVDSSEIQIRVTVSAPTSWGLIGIGVALVAVIGLVIVFRKFSRR
ncbi:MAG: COG1470 family protein [Candidatus Bathyarchaeia archaeon]